MINKTKYLKISIAATTIVTTVIPSMINTVGATTWTPLNSSSVQINLQTNNTFENLKNNIIQLSTKYGHLNNVPQNFQNQIHTIFFSKLTNFEFSQFWNNMSSKYESRGWDFWNWFRGSYLCGVVAYSSTGGLNCGAGGQWQVCQN